MKCLVITGTDFQGVTHKIKELFLRGLEAEEVVEFSLPKDGPGFCTGCKRCFSKGEEFCPHQEKVQRIWNEMKESDLIVFIYPVYCMRAPGQVKALLDHLGVYWMAHRPEPLMFNKRAIIITQSIGAPNGPAQKDLQTSMTWWGISQIDKMAFGLRESDRWEGLSEKRRDEIGERLKKFAKEVSKKSPPKKKSLKVSFFYRLCRKMQKDSYKNLKEDQEVSKDLQHWIDLDFTI